MRDGRFDEDVDVKGESFATDLREDLEERERLNLGATGADALDAELMVAWLE